MGSDVEVKAVHSNLPVARRGWVFHFLINQLCLLLASISDLSSSSKYRPPHMSHTHMYVQSHWC
jgi:hypothetical protein